MVVPVRGHPGERFRHERCVEAVLAPHGAADLAVGADVVRRPQRTVEAEVELQLPGRVLVVAVAHVEAHRLAVGDHVEDHRLQLLELVDVVAPGLGDALGLLAGLGDLHPHHLGLDPAQERVAELLLDVVGDPLQVLPRVRVEQLPRLGVVAVAVDPSHPRVPGQGLEGVQVGHRGQLRLLRPEADVVALAIGEQVRRRPVDELVAAGSDLREPARHHALAVDVAADRDLLEEDVLDPLALDPLLDLGDLRPPGRAPRAPPPGSAGRARSSARRVRPRPRWAPRSWRPSWLLPGCAQRCAGTSCRGHYNRRLNKKVHSAARAAA